GQDVLTVTEGDLGILIFAVSRNAGIRAGQPLAGIREGLLEALAGPQGTEPIGMGRRRAGLGGEDAAKGVVRLLDLPLPEPDQSHLAGVVGSDVEGDPRRRALAGIELDL